MLEVKHGLSTSQAQAHLIGTNSLAEGTIKALLLQMSKLRHRDVKFLDKQ